MVRPMDVVMVLLTWVVLQAPMLPVTGFLFTFDQGTSRMVPVVLHGFWIVGVVVLLVGLIALARTRSSQRAVRLMLASAALAWLVAIGVYWIVSFRLGATAPPPTRP